MVLTSPVPGPSHLAVGQLVKISTAGPSTPVWPDSNIPEVPTNLKGHCLDGSHPPSQGPVNINFNHTHSSLSVAIEMLNLAKGRSCIEPANAVFGSVSSLLTTIRVCVFLPVL